MLFNILLFNHGTGPFDGSPIATLAEYVQNSLISCGHSAIISYSEFRGDAINLVFERFISSEICDLILNIKKSYNAIIGMVATELVVDGKIPYAQSGFGSSAEGISTRLKNADYMARELDFVWSILQRTQEYYSQFTPASYFFPIGAMDKFIHRAPSVPKDIDVIFFGKSTKFRSKILDQCRGTGKRIFAFGDGFEIGHHDFLFVKSLLDRAKIGLCLGFDEFDENSPEVDLRIASRTRFPQMLYHGICIVSEFIPLDNPYLPYIISCRPHDIAHKVRELLNGETWRETGTVLCEQFFSEMNAAKICAAPIAKTLEDLALRGRLPSP